MRIGIILTGDYGWAGGVYYSQNIIKLLQAISTSHNLTIVAIVNAATPPEVIKEIQGKNTEMSFLDQKPFLYKLYYKLKGGRFVADINRLRLDVIYPLMSYERSHAAFNCRAYYWLYDFQHKFLPDLFSKEEIDKRDNAFADIALQAADVVFSSRDSLSHFDEFYPESKVTRHVFNFVSLLDKKILLEKASDRSPSDYFIVCNQFWPHKNHLVVLKALKRLLTKNKEKHVVFTGKYDDVRNKEYVDDLKKFIRQHQLEKQVTFTGFISREEQVDLMANSQAVIQPSFFEGWSTVVEDAKALNKFLIAANLAVNIEQVKKNVLFFDPNSDEQLAACIEQITEHKTELEHIDYGENISRSKDDLATIFQIN